VRTPQQSRPPRGYTMRARQDSVTETRLRITEAVMALHERVGPRHTTVSAVAAEAGVTRLTVYRHFADDAALVAACSQHWAMLHPRPDVDAWRTISDATQRLRTGLSETYRWAETAAPMMTMINRDLDVMPPFVREFLATDHDRRVLALVEPFRARAAARQRIGTVVGHALEITTWESLCRRGHLSEHQAVEVMQAAVAAASR
jgi:AcrR family transcriptional regulator